MLGGCLSVVLPCLVFLIISMSDQVPEIHENVSIGVLEDYFTDHPLDPLNGHPFRDTQVSNVCQEPEGGREGGRKGGREREERMVSE